MADLRSSRAPDAREGHGGPGARTPSGEASVAHVKSAPMRRLVLVLVAVLGSAAVSFALPAADRTRAVREVDNALAFVPDAAQLRAASSGYEEVVADLLWVRAIIIFGERYDAENGPEWLPWVRRMVRAVNLLQPKWRTSFFYGMSLLRVEGDIEGSNEVLRDAVENFPNDSIFPFSLGMNAYLYDEDPEAAAKWLEKAAAVPGAPPWYAAAAAAMHRDAGSREAAMRYLQEVLATTDNEAVRKSTDWQLRRIQTTVLEDSWADLCRQFREEKGRPLASPEELERYAGRKLPENPRGDRWIVAQDGVVRSEGANRDRLRRLRREEWPLAGR